MKKALDLFCGAGGAARGLQQAGFFVVGVDIKRQPRYAGDLFIQGDALNPPVRLEDFDFVWASPVCKRFVDGYAGRVRTTGRVWPDQIGAVRGLLSGHPCWVIENVMRAPIRPDIVLHGHMFPELRVIRRRKFEVSWGGLHLVPGLPRGLLRRGYSCVVGKGGLPSGVRKMGLHWHSADQRRAAMGISWMTEFELSQAVPPAYARFIGEVAMRHILDLATE